MAIIEPGEGRLGGGPRNPPPGMNEGLQRAHAKIPQASPEAHAAISAAAQRLAAPPAYLSINPAAQARWERAYLSSVVKSPALSGIPRTKAIKEIQSQRDSFKQQNVTLQGTSDLLFGKGLTNLVQGQGPHSGKDVLGLGLDALTLIPPTKIARGIGLGADAVRTTVREAGGTRPLLASETGSLFGKPKPGRDVPKAIESHGIRSKFPKTGEASAASDVRSKFPSQGVELPAPRPPSVNTAPPLGDIRSKFPDGSASGAAGLPNVRDRFPSGSASAAEGLPKSPVTEIRSNLLDHVLTGLEDVPALNEKQAAGYSVERGIRAQKAAKAFNDAGGGLAGQLAMSEHLRGELPKVDWAGLSDINQQQIDQVINHIHEHPELRFYESKRASDAFLAALDGKKPTPSELALLHTALGKEGADAVVAHASQMGKLKRLGVEIWNAPRSLQSSFDLSAPMRQGLVTMARHPIISTRNVKPMIKAFGSDAVYHGIIDDIASRDNWDLYQKAKLNITDLGNVLHNREDAFPSPLVDKIPIVRGSSRAYTAFLDKTRADVFDHMIEAAKSSGQDIANPEFLDALGRFINSATGRGKLPAKLENSAAVLNSIFFSPRLMASRFNLISPRYYLQLRQQNPWVARQALRAAIHTVGMVSLMVGLAAEAGAKVVSDPRNPDFGKARFGNTRLDFAAGFQQPIRLLSQMISGTAISSTTGKATALGSGFGKPKKSDLAIRFFRSKLAPSPSFVWDAVDGANVIGQPVDIKKEAALKAAPLLLQDLHDIYNEKQGGTDGITAALAGLGIGVWGVGVQTYGPSVPKSTASSSNAAPGLSAGNPPPGWGTGGGNAAP